MKKKNSYMKLVLIISASIIISTALTYVIALRMVEKKTEGTISELIEDKQTTLTDQTYENVYILSSANDKIIFLYQGVYYETTGSLKKNYTGVANIIVEDNKIRKIQIKEDKVTGKLLSCSESEIEIEKYGSFDRKKNLPVYIQKDPIMVQGKFSDIGEGQTVSLVLANGGICSIIVTPDKQTDTISVLLKNGKSIFYPSLIVSGKHRLTLDGKTSGKKQINVAEYMKEHKLDILRISVSSGKLYFGKDKDSKCKNGYEGIFVIHKTEDGMVLVNQLPIETYLKYVIPSEMPTTFSYEALKAQAVCARTFAYSQMKDTTYQKYQANLDDSTAFQVYNAAGNFSITDKAVEDTTGEVVSYKDKLITCYYFSTCSKKTENMEVWGADTPDYIHMVTSEDKNSPYYSWRATLNLANLVNDKLGPLESITTDKISQNGYVLKLTAHYEKGDVIYTKENDIRFFLGKCLERIRLADDTVRTDMVSVPSACFQIISANDKEVVLLGGGFGHGIGLSQYGADQMAEDGADYREILKYYYNHVEIKDKRKMK